jgi:hypothetical protein
MSNTYCQIVRSALTDPDAADNRAAAYVPQYAKQQFTATDGADHRGLRTRDEEKARERPDSLAAPILPSAWRPPYASAGSPVSAERARRQAATSTGLVIDTRARFGFTAAPGATDDARIRHLTIVLPP